MNSHFQLPIDFAELADPKTDLQHFAFFLYRHVIYGGSSLWDNHLGPVAFTVNLTLGLITYSDKYMRIRMWEGFFFKESFS